MKHNIYRKLIEHVSRNEWSDAKDIFDSVIHEKVALRLEAEKRELQDEEDAVFTPPKPGKAEKKLLVEPEEDDEKDEKDVEECSAAPMKIKEGQKPGTKTPDSKKPWKKYSRPGGYPNLHGK
jgi:hypothetical protein